MKTTTYDETKWKLVPVEPTKEMMSAAVRLVNGGDVYENIVKSALDIEERIYSEVYDSMIAAAPTPRAQSNIARSHRRCNGEIGWP